MKLPTLPPDAPIPPPAFEALAAVQLRTPDLDRSLRFYAGLLGMPIVRTEELPVRRYFLGLGGSWLALEESATPPGNPAVSQISFQVHDVDALEALHKRLLGGGVPVSGLEDLGHGYGCRFRDPVSGVVLQALAQTRAFAPEDRFGDSALVPAAAEILGPKPD
jgi:catechol 2,3-dioxygenase-like lactoylglutathione lyase family enzyme